MFRKVLLSLLIIACTLACEAQVRVTAAYQTYIEQYAPMAVAQMQRYGIPASITLAQGLLESAAGQSTLATKANNHFGIKVGSTWTGPYMLRDDDARNEKFRVYGSPAESYEDHSVFLTKQRYASLFQLSPTDYEGWARGLKKCGYATNPRYADHLIEIIEAYGLQKYDTDEYALLGEFGGAGTVTPTTGNEGSHHRHGSHETGNQGYTSQPQQVAEGSSTARVVDPARQAQGQQLPLYCHEVRWCNQCRYVVSKTGDSYASIAREYGMKESKLRKINEVSQRPSRGQDPSPLTAGNIVYLDQKRVKADKSLKRYQHVVQSGESMHTICQHYGMRLKTLYKVNSLLPSYVPKAGDKLRVR